MHTSPGPRTNTVRSHSRWPLLAKHWKHDCHKSFGINEILLCTYFDVLHVRHTYRFICVTCVTCARCECLCQYKMITYISGRFRNIVARMCWAPCVELHMPNMLRVDWMYFAGNEDAGVETEAFFDGNQQICAIQKLHVCENFPWIDGGQTYICYHRFAEAQRLRLKRMPTIFKFLLTMPGSEIYKENSIEKLKLSNQIKINNCCCDSCSSLGPETHWKALITFQRFNSGLKSADRKPKTQSE